MRFSKKKTFEFLFFFFLFLFFVIWFNSVHPIQVFDTDDWTYTYYIRGAYPIWGDWNPIRMLPEVLMPIVSGFGNYIVCPLLGDFFASLTMAFAIAASLALTLQFWMLKHFLTEKEMSEGTAHMFLLLFLVAHFLVLRSKGAYNRYMLLTENATCLFYYLIPDSLCSAWVLWTYSEGWLHKDVMDHNYAKTGAWLLLTYFCLFSNLWASVIMGAYVGAFLVMELIQEVRVKGFRARKYISAHRIALIVLLIWVTSQVFELSGGRADSLHTSSFMESLHQALVTLRYTDFGYLHHGFLISTLLIIALAVFLLSIYRQTQQIGEIRILGISFILVTIYLVLSCAKAGPGYLERPDVFYGMFFFYMMMVLLCLGEILSMLPWLNCALPLLAIIAAVACNTSGKTFRESNFLQLEPEACRRISKDIVEQYREADRRGEKSMVLYVPVFDSADNFPLATYGGNRIATMLHTYGMTENLIEVAEMIPTEMKNIELNITN